MTNFSHDEKFPNFDARMRETCMRQIHYPCTAALSCDKTEGPKVEPIMRPKKIYI